VKRSAGEIEALVRGYVDGSVDDEAMSRWLKVVFDGGLSPDETFALTMAMASSGRVIDWSGVRGPIVDKHSTGGVGDAVTLVAVPIAAACGVKVAKLSGRALGHTGGTIDKLECVPGLRTDLSIEAFRSIVDRVGCAIASASADLAPADKKMYALRHRTGMVASLPLIAASVMSKKIAAGADAIVLDVKFGRGAFIAKADDARRLAEMMRTIGVRAGRRVTTLLTNMDEPLADSAGDALELDEALLVLEGRGGSRPLRAIALETAAAMVRAGGSAGESPGVVAERALSDGSALSKFAEMVGAQGGKLAAFDRTWPVGLEIPAAADGRIDHIDARLLGEAIADAKRGLPAPAAARVGIRLRHRGGDIVRKGETVLESWLPRSDVRLADAVSIDAGDRVNVR
jgi:pyrimidine-nucleoside phosphorylase